MVNALSGSAPFLTLGAPARPTEGLADRSEPFADLRRFSATEVHRRSGVEGWLTSLHCRSCRSHEVGPIETESTHDEPRQRVEVNARLACFESDDGVRRDP